VDFKISRITQPFWVPQNYNIAIRLAFFFVTEQYFWWAAAKQKQKQKFCTYVQLYQDVSKLPLLFSIKGSYRLAKGRCCY
jgi:hypothetical protein